MGICVIGVGADGALMPPAAAVLAAADVVAGGLRQLALLGADERPRIELAKDVGAAVQRIRQADEAGQRVAVLASGDPLLFGIGATLVREVGADRLTIMPAVSSVQLAFAAINEPWDGAAVLSAHGREVEELLPALRLARTAAILTDGLHTPGVIAQALLAAGLEDCRAVVGEGLGSARQRVVESRLSGLAGLAFDPLNVLLLLREPRAVRLRIGDRDEHYASERGQITKAEVRAVTLAKLRLPPFGTLWDLGAGSGSLAIEAAGLMPHGRVFAIERDPSQLAVLRANVMRFTAANVTVVEGEAPAVLRDLPRPDSVFVGGSGGRLPEILDAIPPPFVINLALLEHLGTVLARHPTAEVIQLQVARGAPAGDGLRLAALNPVFIVTVGV